MLSAYRENFSGTDTCTYLVVPGLVLVVDDRGSQAPRRVDAGAGDGDGGQVHHEHREPNWERSQHLHIYRDPRKNHS